MNWGKWIIVAFVLFAGFIATLMTVCMREEISLVSKDYYKDELVYQDQISRINNANSLDKKPVIVTAGNYIEVDFMQFNEIEGGELKLFRPSDSRMDKVFSLRSTEATKQIFAIEGLSKGHYRARMSWAMNGKEYFIETLVTI